MQDKSNPSGLAPSAWITLLIALVGVFALKQDPFQDLRPANPWAPVYTHAPSDDQDVEARLWDDPLAAVETARGTHDTAPAISAASAGASIPPPCEVVTGSGVAADAVSRDVHSPQHLCDSVRLHLAQATPASLLILANLVSGAPYADDVENRRRSRYAVLAGLYRSGYMPVNNQHIGYVRLSGFFADPVHAHDLAAFEWFERDHAIDGSGFSRVLLLWLDQDAFRNRPISQLLKIEAGIAPHGLSTVVLGPADSDGLRAMADELQASRTRPLNDPRNLTIYSPRATASDDSILSSLTAASRPPGSAPPGLTASFKRWAPTIDFYRTVATDQAVASAVLKELEYQHVNAGEIALVAERDTLYARAMGKYFGGCKNPPREDPGRVPEDDGRAHPLCVTYLKGLDGVGPPKQRQSADSTADDNGADDENPGQNSRTAAAPEAAAGSSQLDYLRRVTATLRALQGECDPQTRQGNCNHRFIKAIGVLSSDIYDKLLILQALRPSFPDVIFFTFDLDARLSDKNSLQWTRQLLVGSSLGLALGAKLQGDIPAFRDSYQATTFYSTLMALHRASAQHAGAGAAEPLMDGAGLQWTAQPLVFEIGRKQAFDLYIDHSASDVCDFDGACASLSQTRTGQFTGSLTPRSALAVIVFLAVTLWMMLRAALGRAAMQRRYRSLNLTSVTAVLALLGVMALQLPFVWRATWNFLTSQNTRMPPPILDGAGHWGKNLIEASLVLLVVMLLVRGQRKLNHNSEQMANEFGFTQSPRDLIAHYARQLRRWPLKRRLNESAWFPFGHLSSVDDKAPLLMGASPLESLIARYLYRGVARRRWQRVMFATLLSTLVLLTLEWLGFSLFGGAAQFVTQVRTHGLKGIIPVVSLVAMQFLIFWVADAMLLTRAFLLDVARDTPRWPKDSLTKARLELGLPEELATIWLNLRLIARRTSWVGSLIWYPSLIIAGMFAATFTIQYGQYRFESNPIVLVISVGMIVAAIVLLRHAAESWRGDVMQGLENRRLLLLSANPLPQDPAQQLEVFINRIAHLREGAFAPYTEQPLVRAVLLPALTFAATSGMQYLHLS